MPISDHTPKSYPKKQREYVYVIFDPLYEDVLCVHKDAHSTCDKCKKVRAEDRNSYQIEVQKFLIK